jgi:hypothetical protein
LERACELDRQSGRDNNFTAALLASKVPHIEAAALQHTMSHVKGYFLDACHPSNHTIMHSNVMYALV